MQHELANTIHRALTDVWVLPQRTTKQQPVLAYNTNEGGLHHHAYFVANTLDEKGQQLRNVMSPGSGPAPL
jgi:hypothetical protein